jgi:uncharacterized membrane protein YdjX (TVP38/TMEM64 family)
MNLTETKQAPTFQNLVEGLGQAQSVDRSHIFVAALFIFALHAKTTFLPLSIPAFVLGSYHEWLLYKSDGISTIKYSLGSLLACWVGTFAYRLAKRRMMVHNLVRHFTPLS